MKRYATYFFLIGLTIQNISLLSADQNNALILNTSQGVAKYYIVINHFRKNISFPSEEYNLSSPNVRIGKIKSICSQKNNKIIYCVGSKACKEAFPYRKSKQILFSSIINWQHVISPAQSKNIFGVSNEFNSEMLLTLFRLFITDMDNIGIIYSDKSNKRIGIQVYTFFFLALKGRQHTSPGQRPG